MLNIIIWDLFWPFFNCCSIEAPSHPHNCSLVNKTAHSLTVECSPGYSGGLEQTFFLQVYSLNPNRLLKNLSNTQQPYFSIDDLPAGYLFKLVIYSSNRKGTSKSIEITGSTTEPSPWKSGMFFFHFYFFFLVFNQNIMMKKKS